jgi:ribosomal protein S18 acetylase RimI-like enzyme
MLVWMIAMDGLNYRPMDPDTDTAGAYENYLEACISSYGSAIGSLSLKRYRAWLRARVEEFPDGHVIVQLGATAVGQLELQAPYGSTTGYINLYAVSPPFRGMGFGRLMHRYVERYFRSWEVRDVELDVSPTNERALNFYRSLGYHYVRDEGKQWRMSLVLDARVEA